MNSLGSKLRDARIEKGYTLNTLQQMTKIQKKYLQAIEEGNYDEMPGNFYVRAFIKQYADVVGLNGDELLQEYESELNLQSDDEFETLSVSDEEDYPSRVQRTGSDQKSTTEVILSYVPLILLIAIIILIMVTLIIAINRIGEVEEQNEVVSSQESTTIVSVVDPDSSIEEESEPQEEQETETASTPELTESQVLVGDQVITQISAPGEPLVYQLEGPIDEYEFGVEASGFVWVGVFEDEIMQIDTTVPEGESVTYQADPNAESVRVSLGYPEGGTFSVNGTELEVPTEQYVDSVLFVVNGDSTTDVDATTTQQETETEPTETEPTETMDYQGPAVLDPDNTVDE